MFAESPCFLAASDRNFSCKTKEDCHSRFECQSSDSHITIGPWPMQLVVPSAVRAAVRIDTMT